jgi:hypothetical protein
MLPHPTALCFLQSTTKSFLDNVAASKYLVHSTKIYISWNGPGKSLPTTQFLEEEYIVTANCKLSWERNNIRWPIAVPSKLSGSLSDHIQSGERDGNKITLKTT